jgi:hypothetical protein
MKDFRSEDLRPLAERFWFNNLRTATFALMPAWIALEATREQLWFDHAKTKAGETLDPDLIKLASQEISAPVAAEFDRLVKEYREISKEKWRELLETVGVEYVERRLYISQGMANNMDALFSTIILESWTAFECLISDLWIVTLDKEDGKLASRVELSGELRPPNKGATADTIKHNIKTSYGSYCLETRRVSFQKLENIKRIYAATFGDDVRKLFDEIKDGYIHALYAFRNAFLHRAGESDVTFRDQTQRFPEFRGISSGDKLLPDGEQVRKMRDASVELGRRLIQVADDVLTPP